jgi:2-polyprenyl-6-methoxyphenol hydroxylase-like FAD-dependent oxidoreductase
MTESSSQTDADGETLTRSDRIAEGSSRDRQILVVGHSLAALATVGFLDRAGLDPVLADGPRGMPDGEVVSIWRPGLDLLEQLGLRRPVEAAGTSLDELRCIEPSQSWTEKTSSRPSLVAIRRDQLTSLFDRRFGGRIHAIDKSVVSVRSTESGVRASFEHDVTEQFDAVVTTDPAMLPRGTVSDRVSPIHWWSFDWPATVSEPNCAVEVWDHTSAAFIVPSDESVRVRLVAGGEMSSRTPLALDDLGGQFGTHFTDLGTAISEFDETTLEYRQLANAAPATLCVDDVALVGPAVHTSIPGGCLGPTLSIEDGWVLADALAYGPASHSNALREYSNRRRGRLARIISKIDDEAFTGRVESDLSGVIRLLCSRRTLAFGHLFESRQ